MLTRCQRTLMWLILLELYDYTGGIETVWQSKHFTAS